MKTAAALFAAVLVSQVAFAETWTAKCSYWSDGGASYDGPCIVTSSTAADGAYAETVKAGDVTIQLVETARQGVWATYTVDGKPSVRFEHNRQSYSYSTLSLDMTLDVDAAE